MEYKFGNFIIYNVHYMCTNVHIAEIEKCHLQFMKQTLKVKMTTNPCVCGDREICGDREVPSLCFH